MELTDEHPLLDLRLFMIPIFTLSAGVSFVLTVGMFGGMLVLPLFLQNLRGLGAAESGVILISQVLPMTVAMPVVGRLVDKVGARTMILLGLPLLALTTADAAWVSIAGNGVVDPAAVARHGAPLRVRKAGRESGRCLLRQPDDRRRSDEDLCRLPLAQGAG